ncbi:unnamed protein product [Brachionus calyciflorus]|uniref:Dual specificity protein phosphatase 15 n=1 Tax=Brachionus calyciflorus TaxID=104777 RepID=A0A813NNL9_9BILA|nr:unnamed protein product [Brachionus calyciflorus]
MGSGMSRILPGLFVGSLKDSQDRTQLKSHHITHIVSVIEEARPNPNCKDIKYFCIKASDSPQQDLQQYFSEVIEFIHKARVLENGNVLIHCLAGISRSVTLAVAYIMTCTELSYENSLNAVRGARKIANPNFGFQRQLQNYEFTRVKTARWRLNRNIGASKYDDEKVCKENIENFWKQFDKKKIAW